MRGAFGPFKRKKKRNCRYVCCSFRWHCYLDVMDGRRDLCLFYGILRAAYKRSVSDNTAPDIGVTSMMEDPPSQYIDYHFLLRNNLVESYRVHSRVRALFNRMSVQSALFIFYCETYVEICLLRLKTNNEMKEIKNMLCNITFG